MVCRTVETLTAFVAYQWIPSGFVAYHWNPKHICGVHVKSYHNANLWRTVELLNKFEAHTANPKHHLCTLLESQTKAHKMTHPGVVQRNLNKNMRENAPSPGPWAGKSGKIIAERFRSRGPGKTYVTGRPHLLLVVGCCWSATHAEAPWGFKKWLRHSRKRAPTSSLYD